MSVNGIQIELLDDRSEQLSHVFSFAPTLSSLYLLAKSGSNDVAGSGQNPREKMPDKRKQKMVEFHEEQPHYKRNLLSHTFLE